MKQVVEMVKGELNIEQRRLFCVAHKNIVGSRRNAWQLLSIEVLATIIVMTCLDSCTA